MGDETSKKALAETIDQMRMTGKRTGDGHEVIPRKNRKNEEPDPEKEKEKEQKKEDCLQSSLQYNSV